MEPMQVNLSAYRTNPTENLVEVSLNRRRLAVIPVPAGQTASFSISEQQTLWVWAGSLLWSWTCLPAGGVLASRDVEDEILTVLPRGGSTIVVAETGVKAVSEDLRSMQLLHDHGEVIVRFERRGNNLILWDFSGATIELPGLFA